MSTAQNHRMDDEDGDDADDEEEIDDEEELVSWYLTLRQT